MSEHTFWMIDIPVVTVGIVYFAWRTVRFIRRLGEAVDFILDEKDSVEEEEVATERLRTEKGER